MPMTENITQTAKFTAKASELIESAAICSRLAPSLAAAVSSRRFSPNRIETARTGQLPFV
jgi:hypothetical protein